VSYALQGHASQIFFSSHFNAEATSWFVESKKSEVFPSWSSRRMQRTEVASGKLAGKLAGNVCQPIFICSLFLLDVLAGGIRPVRPGWFIAPLYCTVSEQQLEVCLFYFSKYSKNFCGTNNRGSHFFFAEKPLKNL